MPEALTAEARRKPPEFSPCGEAGLPDVGFSPPKARCTYTFKLRPTALQVAALERYLDVTRTIYNAALEQRMTAYRMTERGEG